VNALEELIADAPTVLVFTGAGISTGSGIPDFRGPQGIWKTRKPIYFEDFLSSEDARVLYWAYKVEAHETFKSARPNAAHLALAELEHMGKLDTLVTQNIDGLHHDAGNDSRRIIEIHGTARRVECLSCGATSDPEPAIEEFKATKRCPLCACGGFLKTATISFGQPMPENQLARAFEAAERADLVIAIGSTLEVYPAADVPHRARANGASYCIINRGETAQDHLATLRLEGDAAEILPAVIVELRALLSRRARKQPGE
jgi:NAD-dependent deacetylase